MNTEEKVEAMTSRKDPRGTTKKKEDYQDRDMKQQKYLKI
jgi:hypothetical protein